MGPRNVYIKCDMNGFSLRSAVADSQLSQLLNLLSHLNLNDYTTLHTKTLLHIIKICDRIQRSKFVSLPPFMVEKSYLALVPAQSYY